jgi:hypothetical protein
MKNKASIICFAILNSMLIPVYGQGTFQNLDFEDGSFVPFPGGAPNVVYFSDAMPGWTGFRGTNQIDWILHNDVTLSFANVSILGPDYGGGEFMHGHYFVQLQAGYDSSAGAGQVTVAGGIAQTGTLPLGTHTIRFLTGNPYTTGLAVTFAGNWISMFNIGTAANGRSIWGGDISGFAGQNGELRIQGHSYLDDIQFSNQSIPEPGTFGLFGLGALLLGWRFRRKRT